MKKKPRLEDIERWKENSRFLDRYKNMPTLLADEQPRLFDKYMSYAFFNKCPEDMCKMEFYNTWLKNYIDVTSYQKKKGGK